LNAHSTHLGYVTASVMAAQFHPAMTSPINDLTRRIHAENLWLRDLLRDVAMELERLAADREYDAQAEALLARAQRIRARLFERAEAAESSRP